ncbi:AAA family ATPase [Streptosporangiaceae bacterium NEAU-GS5]|nr:AAA family ATPase [Streptosporangiaceae bacterium NEAU-GS5]
MVRLRVLGQLGADVGGRPADLGPALQRAIIARLACAGGDVVSTDRFVEDLWEGQPPPKALAALQVYISNLRRALEPGRAPRTPATVLVTAPPGYRLDLPYDAVDAWWLPRLVEDAVTALGAANPGEALRVVDQALALWTGPAYAEFADRQWAAAEAARLDELRLVAYEYRAEAALALGRHAEVAPEMERHVNAYPLRENAVRLLALAYYRAGRQAEALSALRATKRTLVDELGVDPGPALTALEADILAQSASLSLSLRPVVSLPPPAPSPPSAPAPAGLIGRDAELSRLVWAAEQARQGFRVAWLGGDAGAGKSTLAGALARRLRADDWETVVGRCPETAAGVPPAWAWSEVLRHLCAAVPPAPDLAARLAPLLTDDAAPIGQFWLAKAVGDYLGDARGRLLIVLEDVHRADEETLQLLRHLGTRLAETPVLVLLTHRPSEAGADLLTTGAALAVQTAERVTLGGLGEDEVGRLLSERSGVDGLTPALVRTVTARTGGNPLFVAEIGRLIATEGPSAAHALPPGVRDLIRRRVTRLPAAAQTTLRNAAILGHEADADVLIAMPGADEDVVLDGLEAGVLSGLLDEPRPGRVRFAHILVRETLYEDIPRLRRARMHGKALTALESIRSGDVAALAHHALAAAGPATALSAAAYAARAATQASSLYAHRDAAGLLRAALDALDLDLAPASAPGSASSYASSSEATRLDLLCGLVSALAHAGDVIGAIEARGEALAVARKIGDPAGVVRAATAFDAPAIWMIVPHPRLDAELVRAIEEVLPSQTGEARCRLLATLGHTVVSHDHDLLDSASAEAVAIAREMGDPALLCQALNARYWISCHPYRRAELESIGHELLAAATSAGLLGYQMLGHVVLCMVALGHNDMATARAHADQAAGHATTGQLGVALGILGFLDAAMLLIRGDFDEAEAAYTRLSDMMAAAGGPNAAVLGIGGRCVVRHARGRLHESLPEVLAAEEELSKDGVEIQIRVLIAAGRVEEARAMWQPRMGRVTSYWYWLIMVALRAESAIALGLRDDAEECYRLLLPQDGELAGMSSASLTLGPVARTLGDLAAYLGDTAAAVDHYTRAEEVARQAGSSHWAEAAREARAKIGA